MKNFYLFVFMIVSFIAKSQSVLNVNDANVTVVPSPQIASSDKLDQCVYSGSFATTDPFLTQRIFRDGVGSTCAVKTFPGLFTAGTYYYDTYILANTTGVSSCVSIQVTVSDASFVHLSAYEGVFNPTNQAANFVGDLGSSATSSSPQTMQVTIPSNTYITLVAFSATSGGVSTAPYTITETGLPCNAVTLAVQDLSKDDFSLYPNPSVGDVNVKGMQIKKAKIFDVTGKIIDIAFAGNSLKTSHLQKGVYQVVLENADGKVVKSKFIKQ